MMLLGFVGFTAMDVSLCGTLSSQDVLTFVALDVAVEQIGTPLRTAPGGLPKTAAVTGAGASTAEWLKSIGWVRSPSPAAAGPMARNDAARRAEATMGRGRTPRRMAEGMGVLPDASIGGPYAPIVGRTPNSDHRTGETG